VELRVEALARYAKRQNPEDPISFLEDILFQTIDEVQMAGKITSVSEGAVNTVHILSRGTPWRVDHVCHQLPGNRQGDRDRAKQGPHHRLFANPNLINYETDQTLQKLAQ